MPEQPSDQTTGEQLIESYVAEHLPIDIGALEASLQQANCTYDDPAVILRLSRANQSPTQMAGRTKVFEGLQQKFAEEHPGMIMRRTFEVEYQGYKAAEVDSDALCFEVIRLFTPVTRVHAALDGAGVRVGLVH